MSHELSIVVPPSTLHMLRDIYLTLINIALLNSISHEAVLDVVREYDARRGLTIVRFLIRDKTDIETFLKYLKEKYGLKVRDVDELESLLHDQWLFEYSPQDHKYVLHMGGSVFPWKRYFLARRVGLEVVKYFYSRDIRTLYARGEVISKRKPKPRKGFLDLRWDTRIDFLLSRYLAPHNRYYLTHGDLIGNSVEFLGKSTLLALSNEFFNIGKTIRLKDNISRVFWAYDELGSPDMIYYYLLFLSLVTIKREREHVMYYSSIPFTIYIMKDRYITWHSSIASSDIEFMNQGIEYLNQRSPYDANKLLVTLVKLIEELSRIAGQGDIGRNVALRLLPYVRLVCDSLVSLRVPQDELYQLIRIVSTLELSNPDYYRILSGILRQIID